MKHFREAYTSERWIVRIYEVMPLANLDPKKEPKYSITASQLNVNKNKVSRPTI
jgi:hypothetical protein